MLKDKILSAACATTPPQAVEVPEWGVTIYLRQLTLGSWLDLIRERETFGDRIVFEVLARTAVDEEGNQLFTTAEIEALPAAQLHVVQRLFGEAQKLQIGDRDPKD